EFVHCADAAVCATITGTAAPQSVAGQWHPDCLRHHVPAHPGVLRVAGAGIAEAVTGAGDCHDAGAVFAGTADLATSSVVEGEQPGADTQSTGTENGSEVRHAAG